MTVRSRLDDALRGLAVTLLPKAARDRLRALQRRWRLQRIPVGTLDFGDLRRLDPVSAVFGFDRDAVPVDRWLIEDFLARNADAIRGRVLEMGDPAYTVKFGGDRVTRSDVLHYVEGNPLATFVGDLTDAPQIPDDTFDCIIITQTLQMIFEIDRAIATLHRILKPGGIVLATSHGISRVARREGVDDWGEYWHLTTQSARRLFRTAFPGGRVEVTSAGNVLTAIATLHGLGAGDLDPSELAHHDPNYEILVLVRAEKAGGATGLT